MALSMLSMKLMLNLKLNQTYAVLTTNAQNPSALFSNIKHHAFLIVFIGYHLFIRSQCRQTVKNRMPSPWFINLPGDILNNTTKRMRRALKNPMVTLLWPAEKKKGK